MSAPGWLRWALAAAMIAVACYHLARLVRARIGRGAIHRDVELGHAGMGVVMTAMLVGSLSESHSRDLALIFVASMLWFASRSIGRYVLDGPRGVGPLLEPAVGCASMVYMLAVLAGIGGSSTMAGMSMPDSATMAGMSMPGQPSPLAVLTSPVLGTVLVLVTVALAAWSVGRWRIRVELVGDSVTPVLGLGCGLAVNVTTVCMLVAR